MVVATPNGLGGSCGGGTITATANSAVVSLSGATLAAKAECTFSVKVTTVITGVSQNVTSALTSANAGPGATASATLTVTGSRPTLRARVRSTRYERFHDPDGAAPPR